jgi:hypothetical protein
MVRSNGKAPVLHRKRIDGAEVVALGRFQFSLAALFGLVTAAALVLAALTYVPLARVMAVIGLMISGAFLGLGVAVLVLTALLEQALRLLSPMRRPHRRR